VVILLESFSKEYCALGGKNSFTPFFDSLIGHSLVFTNAFSNSSKSIEGIPAVLSSLPSYMEIPFINSMYANNYQTSFASLLGKEGYETAFFHGGSNGTMNFVQWSAAAGYKQYFGRDEYNNESDFDGYWGIWDEPFLQFAVQKMSEFQQPFHSAVFTLSSHHPYMVPEKYHNKFPKGKEDFEAALRYADYSLRRFFEAASRTIWYNNTLFVMVADHAIVSDKYLDNALASLTIPAAFFKPDHSLKGRNESVFFQHDVLPQAMQLIGYNKPFFSFGKDPAKKKDHLGCYFGNGYYSTFTDSMLITYVGTKTQGVYNYLRDTALYNNVKGKYPDIEALIGKNFRAMIQTYNHTLNTNSGKVDEKGF
jgi:phosphoglycerol transferase MdoB-like AlkP superfamily enzyme